MPRKVAEFVNKPGQRMPPEYYLGILQNRILENKDAPANAISLAVKQCREIESAMGDEGSLSAALSIKDIEATTESESGYRFKELPGPKEVKLEQDPRLPEQGADSDEVLADLEREQGRILARALKGDGTHGRG